MMEWHWTICKSLPNQQHQSTEGYQPTYMYLIYVDNAALANLIQVLDLLKHLKENQVVGIVFVRVSHCHTMSHNINTTASNCNASLLALFSTH